MVATGCLIGLERDVFTWLPLLFGWLFATLIFSPDTDLMPKKRSGVLQFFLYPYSILFKHRGLSHGLITGTISRILYAIVVGGLLVFILSKMGHVDFTAQGYWLGLWHFAQDYDYSLPGYRALTWLYLGMAGADACHILLDWFWGLLGRVRRYY